MGGVAVYLSFTTCVAAAYVLVLLSARDGGLAALIPDQVRELSPGMIKQGPMLAAIMAGGFFILTMGLADDKWNIGPKTKLLIQAAIGAVLVLAGVKLDLFLESDLIQGVLTILWLLTVINAVNFLDNMDGLAAGVCAIAALFFLLTALQYGQFFVSAMLATFAGAILGFLIYNIHPASIIMGDAGSLFLGYLLGVLTTLGTFHSSENPTVFPIIVPLVVLAIPLYEMVSVTAIRLGKRLSPFRASKDHFSFRMRGLGLGVRAAVSFIYLVTICTGVAALLLPQLDTLGAILDLLLVGLLLTIVALFEYWGGRLAQRELPRRGEK
jgi:UDP-GlcNAc:undecaprenyl-phosphate GlcNAc-1-phosphate transferase